MSTPTPEHPLTERLLIVGLDGADLQLVQAMIEAGALPCLADVAGRGVLGPLTGVSPLVPVAQWTSMLTGRLAADHGVLGPLHVDGEGAVQATTSRQRQVPALWTMTSAAGLDTVAVNWPASHPAEPVRGVAVSDLFALATGDLDAPGPLPAGCVSPADAAEALDPLRVHPSELDFSVFPHFIPAAAEIDQSSDNTLRELGILLAETAGVHAAITDLLTERPWSMAAVRYTFIDQVCRRFLPFHPPAMAGLPPELSDRLSQVVTGAYAYADAMLHALLTIAGDDTTLMLVSNHGYYQGDARPDIIAMPPRTHWSAWKRRTGLIAMAGPGLRPKPALFGAHALDVTPTALALLGLPAGQDMPGKALAGVIALSGPPRRISRWALDGETAAPPDPDPDAGQLALMRAVASGEADTELLAADDAADRVARSNEFTAARSLLDANRPEAAIRRLQALDERYPRDNPIRIHLARALAASGDRDQARALLEAVAADHTGGPAPNVEALLAELAAADSPDEALVHLFRAEQVRRDDPSLHLRIGRVYLRAEQWSDAERAFNEVLALDPEAAQAHLGLAIAHNRQDRFAEAVEASLAAIDFDFRLVDAHVELGIALARQDKAVEAVRALETALTLDPERAQTHEWLAALFDQALDEPERAEQHRKAAVHYKIKAEVGKLAG